MPFRYPPALYARKVQGNVTLRLFIDRDGRPKNDSTRVEESSGMESLDVLRQNLGVAHGFTPMSDDEMRRLRERCAEMAGDGRFEHFKTTLKYEGPIGRAQHGFPAPGEHGA